MVNGIIKTSGTTRKRGNEKDGNDVEGTPSGRGEAGLIGEISLATKGNEFQDKVRIEVILDSGAADHMIPEHAAPMFPSKEMEVSRKGMYYRK